jgi:flagellar biosynthetic protein FliR
MTPLLEIDQTMLAALWPLLRVSGVVLVAPVLSSAYVPIRIRALIAVVLTFVVSPFAGDPPAVAALSPSFILIVLRELAIGFSIGFLLRLVIEVAIVGGQILATSMGLHFATVIDPHQGGTPTLSQFYVIVATLLLLATNTHLALIDILARSFELLPIASASFGAEQAWLTLEFGGRMFAGGLQLALPSVAAILMVNVAFGVVSRAAPTLNLFAVGFPVAMFVGFLVMVLSIEALYPIWSSAVADTLSRMLMLAGGG